MKISQKFGLFDKRYARADVSGALMSETLPRFALTAAAAPSAGNAYGCRIALGTGSFTTVTIVTGATQGVTLANTFFGIYDIESNARLSVSADVSTTVAAIAPNTSGTVTLNTTVTEAKDYWLAFVIGSAVTMPTLQRWSAPSSVFLALAPAIATRHSSTGLTALPTTLVPVSTSLVSFWFRYE